MNGGLRYCCTSLLDPKLKAPLFVEIGKALILQQIKGSQSVFRIPIYLIIRNIAVSVHPYYESAVFRVSIECSPPLINYSLPPTVHSESSIVFVDDGLEWKNF